MIKAILKKQLSFEGAPNYDKFSSIFSRLYNIDIYKKGLDLILTKCRENDLNFEVKIQKGWDTNVGCYLTEQNKTFNKIAGVFTNKLKHKIIIRSLKINVMAHEMAHALELESGLNLGGDFRKAIGYDMKGRSPDNIALKGEIQRLMIDALESYPSHQFLSELFARFFELLSVSKDFTKGGSFTIAQVEDFFANTTKWIKEVFNQTIENKIDQDISAYSSKLIAQNKIEKEEKFSEKVDSFHKRGKGWATNTSSNSRWQKSWQQYDKTKQIGNDDNKKIEE